MASAASPLAASAGASPRRYEPRCAEANLVRRIVEEELDGFLAEAEARGQNVCRCGAVTFIQRFGGALNLNVHFHTLFLDGVYEVLPRSSGLRFRPLPLCFS